MESFSVGRLEELDAVRGLAALTVVASHYVLTYPIPYGRRLLEDTPLHFWWDGAAAVCLFFVLSGLVLSIRLFRGNAAENLSRFDITGFALARFARIWVPYMVVCLASAVLAHRGYQYVRGSGASQWLTGLWKNQPQQLVGQMLDFRITANKLLLPQAWTLEFEICLAVLIPVGVCIALWSTTALLVIAFACAMSHVTTGFIVHFALGIALAKHFGACLQAFRSSRAIAFLVVAGGLFCHTYGFFFPHVVLLHLQNFDHLVPAIGSAAILLAVSGSETACRFFRGRVLGHLGRISFSLYLVHMIVLITLTQRIVRAVSSLGTGHAWLIGLAFTVVASLVAGEVCFHVLEVPTIQLSRWLKAGIPMRWSIDRRPTAEPVAAVQIA